MHHDISIFFLLDCRHRSSAHVCPLALHSADVHLSASRVTARLRNRKRTLFPRIHDRIGFRNKQQQHQIGASLQVLCVLSHNYSTCQQLLSLIHPFYLTPPALMTTKTISLLRQIWGEGGGLTMNLKKNMVCPNTDYFYLSILFLQPAIPRTTYPLFTMPSDRKFVSSAGRRQRWRKLWGLKATRGMGGAPFCLKSGRHMLLLLLLLLLLPWLLALILSGCC